MSTADLNGVAVEAARLQNGYAVAVDTRKWGYFRTLFVSDVLAVYPNATYEGIAAWLEFFVPFHADCLWTQHAMHTHLLGADDRGVWASCYGSVRWVHRSEPDRINRCEVIYRDRLQRGEAGWQIARRKLDIVLQEIAVGIPSGITLPKSILDFADMT